MGFLRFRFRPRLRFRLGFLRFRLGYLWFRLRFLRSRFVFCFRLRLSDFLLMLLLHDPIYSAIFFQIINKADTLFFVAVSEQFPRFP